MPNYVQYSPWRDAANVGSGLADRLSQILLEQPRLNAQLKLEQAKLGLQQKEAQDHSDDADAMRMHQANQDLTAFQQMKDLAEVRKAQSAYYNRKGQVIRLGNGQAVIMEDDGQMQPVDDGGQNQIPDVSDSLGLPQQGLDLQAPPQGMGMVGLQPNSNPAPRPAMPIQAPASIGTNGTSINSIGGGMRLLSIPQPQKTGAMGVGLGTRILAPGSVLMQNGAPVYTNMNAAPKNFSPPVGLTKALGAAAVNNQDTNNVAIDIPGVISTIANGLKTYQQQMGGQGMQQPGLMPQGTNPIQQKRYIYQNGQLIPQ